MSIDLATHGLVLRRRAYGESDRIVTFLTEDHGKLTGIAKGAKNSKRRFAGTLEPFVHVRVTFRQRSTSDLAFLVQCDLLQAMREFSRDLDRYAAGTYVLDLTDRMVFGQESGHDVYGLVLEALLLLDGGAEIDTLLRAFELKLLAMSGYGAPWNRCRRCGGDAAPGTPFYLIAKRGEIVCRRCVPVDVVVKPFATDTAHALARLAEQPLADATAGRNLLAESRAIVDQLLANVTEGPIRSRAFLGLGAVR